MVSQANTNKALLLFCYAAIIALVLLNAKNGFFWDTVLYGSKQGNFYFDTHFTQLLLPDAIDSGTVPVFGLYLAAIWSLFGRSIEVSHLAMLPFVIGIVWQLNALCNRFIPKPYTGIALLLLLSDATLLGQMTLVSPDIPLLFCFLMALHAVLNNNRKLLTVALLLLFVIHTRGIMISLALLVADLYRNVDFRQKPQTVFVKLCRRSLIYLPALLVLVAFQYYHQIEKGWIFTHNDSPWKATQQTVDFKGFLTNLLILCWRLLDYGKCIIWLIAALLLLRSKRLFLANRESRSLLVLALALLLLVHIDMLFASGLLAHRYFMPFNTVWGLFIAALLFGDWLSRKRKHILAALWLIVSLCGNCWIYPDNISQGWDATLAHLPYYKLRQQALHYLDAQQIDYKNVASFFPNRATLDEIDLNHDLRQFSDFDDRAAYVFFSNVYNVDTEKLTKIADPKRYQAVKKFESKGVYITIYKRLPQN